MHAPNNISKNKIVKSGIAKIPHPRYFRPLANATMLAIIKISQMRRVEELKKLTITVSLLFP